MENKIKINCVIGIDPGKNGGIAIYIPGQLAKAVKMPKDVADLRDLLGYYAENYNPIVFLEKLSVRPDDVAVQGEKPNMGKIYRIQTMMANYEHLRAIIETTGVPYVLVHPGKWTSYLNLRIIRKQGPKETKQERKNRYKEFAAHNYPEIKITLWNADALNIMHFGRKVLVNDLNWVRANLPKREHPKLF